MKRTKTETNLDRQFHEATADARIEFHRSVREARKRYELTKTYPPTPSELTLYAREVTTAWESLYAAIDAARPTQEDS